MVRAVPLYGIGSRFESGCFHEVRDQLFEIRGSLNSGEAVLWLSDICSHPGRVADR